MSLLEDLIKEGEGLRLEFKEAKAKLPKSFYETVCAFLNREGGKILLGVSDEAELIGVDESELERIKKEIADNSNNSELINPTFLLFPKVEEIKNKKIISVEVPRSSLVHSYKGKIFDRSEDGDYEVKDHFQKSSLYLRKSNEFSETKVYPYMKMTHFKGELFTKVRNLLRIRDENHSLLGLNDEDLLRALGFYRSDLEKGIEAYTLAAALLFGTDETIQNIAPHFKVDALVRIKDLDRYDDRLEIRTNLIEAYELLMAFIQKHLPDPFYEENGIRISLRSKIFREIVANILVHAEYSIPSFTRFIIYEDRVEAENPSRAFRSGPITLETLSPKPKNPLLAKLSIQIGRVEELGSGVRRTNQYVPIYASGETPQFIDGDVFKTIIPLKNNGGVSGGVSGGVKPEYTGVLKLIHSGKANKIKEISEALGISVRSTERLIRELKDRGLIYYDGSAKTGGYFLKELGLRSL